MQRSNLEPKRGRCACGRKLSAAAIYIYRSHSDCYLFHICECGTEWTEHQTDIDPRDPVSSDEVIEVHRRLAKFDGTFFELLHQLSS
jgi:hypothetical protein